jgi:hypothetical protein
MRRAALTFIVLFLAFASSLLAQDKQKKIQSALSAGPASVTENAKVMDWDQTLLREGSNSWTCFPDIPDTPGNDPMCLDEPWLNWVDAWVNKKQLNITRMGFGYMLQGSSPASNTDPYAGEPTPDNEWMDESVPHIMVLVPDAAALSGLPTDPKGGGPWVMWRGTPFVHIMVPTPKKGM